MDQPHITENAGRTAVLHLFGPTASVEFSNHVTIKVDGKFLGDGPNIFVAIHKAVQARCKNTGEDPVRLLGESLAAYRKDRPHLSNTTTTTAPR